MFGRKGRPSRGPLLVCPNCGVVLRQEQFEKAVITPPENAARRDSQRRG